MSFWRKFCKVRDVDTAESEAALGRLREAEAEIAAQWPEVRRKRKKADEATLRLRKIYAENHLSDHVREALKGTR